MNKFVRFSARSVIGGMLLISSSLAISAPTAIAEDKSMLPPVAAEDIRAEIKSLTLDERRILQAEIDDTITKTNNGAVQISANEVSWNGGEPIVTFPLPGEKRVPAPSEAALLLDNVDPADINGIQAQAAEPDWKGCPAGASDNRWYCFYQWPNFEGKMIKWNWAHCGTGIIEPKRFGCLAR
ncbi:peptidase inhibitor family I36 protein [Streptomyces sp. NPDC051561]|uniref:peptidase inhibitor family I36 protein n=1 Tax=Streptomyces sp. NPDC051561 TaxID=3365658 RepID=UPI00378EFC08